MLTDAEHVEPGLVGARNARAGRQLPAVINATMEDAAIRPGTVPNVGLFDVLEHMPPSGSMPTPEDMASTNASNAEARAKAIADGMDEGTADILYPDFATPEDMNRIN